MSSNKIKRKDEGGYSLIILASDEIRIKVVGKTNLVDEVVSLLENEGLFKQIHDIDEAGELR